MKQVALWPPGNNMVWRWPAGLSFGKTGRAVGPRIIFRVRDFFADNAADRA